MARNVIQAEHTIETLYYMGEKHPLMWWDKFEQELREAYAIVDRHEGRQVHSDEAKLRKLVNQRIMSDSLSGVKSGLQVDMNRGLNMQTNFELAMSTFRNVIYAEVQKQQAMGLLGQRRRGQALRINEVGKAGSNTTTERLSDGSTIDYHPSKYYSRQVILEFPKELYGRMMRERAEYKERNKKGGGKKQGKPNPRKRISKVKTLNARMQELEAKVRAQEETRFGWRRTAQVAAALVNPMGGRNERRQGRGQQASLATRIAALEAQLGPSIGAVQISINETRAISTTRASAIERLSDVRGVKMMMAEVFSL